MNKEYYLSILSGHQRGLFATIIRSFLSVLAFLYLAGLHTRSALYRYGITKRKTLPAKVISIGNITAGGTGKTPLVEFLARYLRTKKKKIAILSRGYGGRIPSGSECDKSPENGKFKNRNGVNDEYLILSENLEGIPILLGKNRLYNGEKAIINYGSECLILDDGFQHIKLKRDLDIVVIDALNPFAGEHLIPRGFLREPVKGLKRADLFVISHCNQINEDRLRTLYTKLQNFNKNIYICESIHEPAYLENISDNSLWNTSWLRGKRIYGLCAIGNPQSFAVTLKELGVCLVQFRTYLDHHAYTQAELDNVIAEAKHLGADAIVVTQKDAVKLRNKDIHDANVMSLKIEIRITKGIEFFEEAVSNVFNSD